MRIVGYCFHICGLYCYSAYSIIQLAYQLVQPVILQNCFIILLSVYYVKVPLKIHVCASRPIEIICYTSQDHRMIRAKFLTI